LSGKNSGKGDEGQRHDISGDENDVVGTEVSVRVEDTTPENISTRRPVYSFTRCLKSSLTTTYCRSLASKLKRIEGSKDLHDIVEEYKALQSKSKAVIAYAVYVRHFHFLQPEHCISIRRVSNVINFIIS
jgi:ATP-dependent protease Clp ATPase subunit